MDGQWLPRFAILFLLAAGKALIFIREDFSVCKCFEDFHVKVHLAEKQSGDVRKNLSTRVLSPDQPGDTGKSTLQAIFDDNFYRFRPQNWVREREVICTLTGPAEQKRD